ncbi:MAG: 6-carboxytetrahydropterin synthase QueD [Spirochaetaceae bacterium]|jgi:6-pyruvoyltetrahydropterin/6-carboxytetrahydropterin synthase|nr:6-carboxytetrahydropterin synthase QueD [Spirochaetaceae bacterium]
MFEIRVEANFSAAHFLKDYHGRCENLHGHNYLVRAHFRGETLDNGGMLIDFTQAKQALRDICADLDHRSLNDLPIFAQNPSAERIARHIYGKLAAAQPLLWAIDVYETPENRARYMGGSGVEPSTSWV